MQNNGNDVLALLNPSALRVLSVIWNEGPIARTTIAERTGFAHSSITRITRTLEESRLIVETMIPDTPENKPVRGRPKVMLTINAEAGAVLAVDLSGILLQGAIYSTNGVNLFRSEEPFAGTGEQNILRQVVALITRLRAESARLNRSALAIAVSVPGVIDQMNGLIVEVTNLDLHNFSLAEALSREFLLPVFIEHDTMAAAYAERFYGAGMENESLIFVLVSQGIGAGLLLNNQIYRGMFGAAGELGHITIEPNGPECLCGRRGCLESLAGAQAILDYVRNEIAIEAERDANDHPHTSGRTTILDPDALTMSAVIQAAAAGDGIARRALERTGRYVAQAIGILAAILDVRCIIVGGEIADAQNLFMDSVRHYLPHYLFPSEHRVSIHSSRLRQEAAIKGVSILALHQVLGFYQ